MEEFLEKEELVCFHILQNIRERDLENVKRRFLVKKFRKHTYGGVGVVHKPLGDLHMFWSELPDGTAHGKCESFYEGTSMRKATSCDFVNGRVEGKYTLWYKNGEIREEIEFRNGERHGYHTQWNKNATMKVRLSCSGGKCFEIEGYRRKIIFWGITSHPKDGCEKPGFFVEKEHAHDGQLASVCKYVISGQEKSFVELPMIKYSGMDYDSQFGLEELWHTRTVTPNGLNPEIYSIYRRTERNNGFATHITEWNDDGTLQRMSWWSGPYSGNYVMDA